MFKPKIGNEELIKTPTGYDRITGLLVDFHYDHQGNYVGQTQPNMMDDDDPDAPADLYFSAQFIDGKPCENGKPVPPLTRMQMWTAVGPVRQSLRKALKDARSAMRRLKRRHFPKKYFDSFGRHGI